MVLAQARPAAAASARRRRREPHAYSRTSPSSARAGFRWAATPLADAVPRLREQVAAAGRDPDGLEIIPFTTAQTLHEKIDALERAGGTEIAFDIRPADGPTVRDVLDRLAACVAERRAG